MIARILLCIVALVMPPFGGEPPWGLEQPTHIVGEVHRGEGFVRPIGDGLYFKLVPLVRDCSKILPSRWER